jgi:hypothetical protein
MGGGTAGVLSLEAEIFEDVSVGDLHQSPASAADGFL